MCGWACQRGRVWARARTKHYMRTEGEADGRRGLHDAVAHAGGADRNAAEATPAGAAAVQDRAPDQLHAERCQGECEITGRDVAAGNAV